MNCPKCNNEVREGAAFCTECGSKIETKEEFIFCEECGSKLEKGSLFCTECGTKVGDTPKKEEKKETKKETKKEIKKDVVLCSGCGTELEKGSLFCTECGTKVGETPKKEEKKETKKEAKPAKKEKSEDGHTATLTVSRKKSIKGCAITFHVLVDGVKVGDLKNGASVTTELTEGVHKVTISTIDKDTDQPVEVTKDRNSIEILTVAKMGLVAAKADIVDVIFK